MNQTYVKIVEDYFRDQSFDMIAPPTEHMPFPFVDPGPQYRGSLWDWDSYFSVRALIGICENFRDDPSFDYEGRRSSVIEAAKGCVRNFLKYQMEDGYIPIVLTEDFIQSGIWPEWHKKDIINQHKPFLCQSILQVSRFAGDFSWFPVEPLIRYMEYYRREQYHRASGLYVFKSDYMIGIDNNPAVYGFPYGSTGDLYLNTFMYMELCAFADLLDELKDGRAAGYRAEAERLKEAIRAECYDPRDELYYSVFLDLSNTRHAELGWHAGMNLHWKTLPLRMRVAICFAPMYAGIATQEQCERMIERHLTDPKFLSAHGLRSTACDEKVYSLAATSNPSNSLGPVWLIYNYFAFFGLLRCGRRDLAEKLCEAMVENFARDIQKNGRTDECYNPETGEPIMHRSFLSWNSLIMPMILALK